MKRGWQTGPVGEPGRSKRDSVEEAMMLLARLEIDVDELNLRTEQAITRAAQVLPVLGPAVERLVVMRQEVQKAKCVLHQVWLDGQALHWDEDSSS